MWEAAFFIFGGYMTKLEQARETINKVDAQIADLFQQRMEACKEVANFKKENGLSIRDKEREAALIQANCKFIKNPEIESFYVQFLKNCIDISCDYQEQILQGMKIAYCGTEGAYAYSAAKTMFPYAQLFSYKDFEGVYHGVEKGEYDACVLPLENSYAGEVGTVMDLIFSGSLYINQVIDLPITHNLMAIKGSSLSNIKTVVSHTQALSQCANYLHSQGFESEPYSNTALAAKFVMEKADPTIAAIASEETAQLFNLEILDRSINDNKNNTTRFAVFSRIQNKPLVKEKKENQHFILVFTVKNEAGALAQTLNIIGAHGFNMRNLRSRPMKDLQWSYYFYIEAEGNINSQNGKDMLTELSAICAKLKLVGSYFDIRKDI